MIEFIFKKIFQEIIGFFQRWYLEGSEVFWSGVFSLLAVLDREFAVLINLRLITQPLYGDYSPVGRILGPILRLLRVLTGSMVYLLILVSALVLWLIWLLLLPGAFFLIINQWGT